MEIDIPEHAVGIWIVGDDFRIRIPGRHEIAIPVTNTGQLVALLRTRAERPREAKRIGTESAPVQYDIDLIAAALRSNDKKISEAAVERKAKIRRGLLRRANAAWEAKNRPTLEELGLA